MELASIYKIISHEASGDEISARISFNEDHPVFKGHFPGNPIVPGVVQVQIFKDLLEQKLGRKLFLNQTKFIKFLNVINPLMAGEVQFEIFYTKLNEDNFNVKCTVKTDQMVYMKYSGNAQVLLQEK